MIPYIHPEVATICWTYPFGYRDDLPGAPGSVHVIEHMIVDGRGNSALRRLSDHGVLLNVRTLADSMQFTYTFHPERASFVLATHLELIATPATLDTLAHGRTIVEQETLESMAKLAGRTENWVTLQRSIFASSALSTDGFGYGVSRWHHDTYRKVIELGERIRSCRPSIVGCGQINVNDLNDALSPCEWSRPADDYLHRQVELLPADSGRPNNPRSRHLLGIPVEYDALGGSQHLALWFFVESLRKYLQETMETSDVGMGLFGPFGIIGADCIPILYTPTEPTSSTDVDFIRKAIEMVDERLDDNHHFVEVRDSVVSNLDKLTALPDQHAAIAGKLALTSMIDITTARANLLAITPEVVRSEIHKISERPIFSVIDQVTR